LDAEAAAAHGFARRSSSVRLNHYPVGDPVPEGERAGLRPLGEVALGHHTDPGVITLLLQDQTGGLQAESPEHGWIDVPPRPGTVVVNLADAMQVWTNDRYRAAVHRVVPMTDTDRYSIPFFANPAGDRVIRPIATLAGGAPRYRPFTWGAFMQGRIDDNYRDRGTEDIQIARYATTRSS
jgi:isopenicillin N synthase-like dioxygenase